MSDPNTLVEAPAPADPLAQWGDTTLTKPTGWPKNPQESQTLLATSREELDERLGRSGGSSPRGSGCT